MVYSQVSKVALALVVLSWLTTPAPAAESAPRQQQRTARKVQSPRSTASTTATAAEPQPPAPKKPVLVPGTGTVVLNAGDDFEDEKWNWNYRHPKSSEEQDKRVRAPVGKSINGKWFEGMKRGTPDVVKRLALPAPGLEGSEYGLLISSLHTGIPGRLSYKMEQDDLIFNMQRSYGRGISVGDSPSVVTRVYLPPFEQWENRSGPSFGFRAGCFTHAIITGDDHPERPGERPECPPAGPRTHRTPRDALGKSAPARPGPRPGSQRHDHTKGYHGPDRQRKQSDPRARLGSRI
jgi:hypothetical protein